MKNFSLNSSTLHSQLFVTPTFKIYNSTFKIVKNSFKISNLTFKIYKKFQNLQNLLSKA